MIDARINNFFLSTEWENNDQERMDAFRNTSTVYIKKDGPIGLGVQANVALQRQSEMAIRSKTKQ